MHDLLSPVWTEVEKYIQEGLSIIPIRDKQEGNRPAKSPYGAWKLSQTTALPMPELWSQMDHHKTTAVGIVCGQVSGNLEVIDIDVKYLPGIDGSLFKHLKEFYPELLDRLRIQKTPSGGFHIIYRCVNPIPGNQKLAGRAATDEELVTNPKTKTYHFLETRGEGGYIAAAPALGYSIRKANPIPVLTQDERDRLINFCRSFNQVHEQVREYKSTATDSTIYDENPFEDYTNRVDGPELAIQLGWTFVKSSGQFTWLTRPGGTKNNVHASWIADKRLFKIFTSKTDLEENKSYNPVNFLATLKFGGDKKATYAYLVQNGYGKIKPKVEQAIAKKAAINGTGVAANFSDAGKQALAQQKTALAEAHPFGIFWETDDDGKVLISRERLYTVADSLGFKLWRGDIVQLVGNFIHERTQRQFYDSITGYIKEEDGNLAEDIFNSADSFLQNNGKHIILMLVELQPNQFVTDTRTECNKFFTNGFLRISITGHTFHPYTDLFLPVFYSRVQQREYHLGNGGLYVQYLDYAVGVSAYLKRVVGFLSHEYKDNSLAYIVILTEQAPDPKDGGGSGKNLFGHLLKGTTSVTGKAASQTKKMDETIFQIWNGEKVFAINDLPPDFDLVFFKDISSDGFVLKKLYKNEIYISSEDGFKPLLSTNFSYHVSDGGLLRRIIPVEFTEFFTKQGGVKKYFYGKLFPNDWSNIDWAGYDNFIAESVVEWFKCGMELSPEELSKSGWKKQFIQNFSQTAHDLISKHWLQWLETGFVTNDEFRKQIDEFYIENGTANDRFKLSPQKLNAAITEWGNKNGFVYEKEYVRKMEFNIPKKGKLFIEQNKPPF